MVRSLLGANGLSSLALAALALQRSQSLPAQDLALEQLDRLAAGCPLDARRSGLAAGCGSPVVRAEPGPGRRPCRPAGDRRAGDILWSRGGLWRQTECRLHLSQLSYAELRASPAGWLCTAALISGGGGLAFGPALAAPSGGPAPGGRPAAWVLPAAACTAGPGTAQPHLLPACGDGAGHLPGLSAAVPPGDARPDCTAAAATACGLLLGRTGRVSAGGAWPRQGG